jgi:3-hydroxyisobutyrate dehydrogenase-like beta-hydroxyacid dehydrogenase
MAKDTALCLREAARLDFPMSIGGAVQSAWAEADAGGEDSDDFTVIAKLFEARAGVTIAPLE